MRREVRAAIKAQDKIGWWSFLQGRITVEMEAVVAEQYRRTSSKKKHNKWTMNLIKQLWEIQWRLWEHRNNVEHHHMTPAKQQQLDNMLAKANDELHQGCEDVLSQDRHLFADHDKVLSLSLDDLRL